MERRSGASGTRLDRVRDAETICELVRLVDAIVDCPGRMRLEALALRHWVAVPVESANHLDKEVMARLVSYCQGTAVGLLFAVETEVDVTEREAHSLPASAEGLVSFNRELGLMYCALFPPGVEWLILCTRDEHFGVAGPREFVRFIVGKPLDEALREFCDFAADQAWSTDERKFLENVCERYMTAKMEELDS